MMKTKKHLYFLQKIESEKMTGQLKIQFFSGELGNVEFRSGHMVDCPEDMMRKAAILPVVHFEWQEAVVEQGWISIFG